VRELPTELLPSSLMLPFRVSPVLSRPTDGPTNTESGRDFFAADGDEGDAWGDGESRFMLIADELVLAFTTKFGREGLFCMTWSVGKRGSRGET
jgi:hypothetical protein